MISRGAGFGFTGSAVVSLIYLAVYTIFFSVEASIVAATLASYFGLDFSISALAVGLICVPLTIYGMKFMEKFQAYTLPIFLLLLILMILSLNLDPRLVSRADGWLTYLPRGASLGGDYFFTALGAWFGFVGANSILIPDFCRFANKRSTQSAVRIAILTIPANALQYLIAVPIGIYLSVATGTNNPGIYAINLIGLPGLIFIMLSQFRILNYVVYGASLTASNFFSRVGRLVPGRFYWGVAYVVIGTVITEVQIVHYLLNVLTFMGIFIFAWLGTLLSDLYIVKGRMDLGPKGVEYRRPYIPAFNIVGLGSLGISLAIGLALAFGGFFHQYGSLSTILFNISSPLTLVFAFCITPILAKITEGKTYLLRRPTIARDDTIVEFPMDYQVVECPRCGEIASTGDLVPCPYYDDWICSHCCMRNKNCNDVCRQSTKDELLRIHPPARLKD